MDTPEEVFENFGIELHHYGIPGMRWGVRRDVGRNGRVIKRGSAGGETRAPADSEDYQTTKKLRGKKLNQMSNAEIAALNRRLQLEASYNQMLKDTKSVNKGHKAAKDTLAIIGTVNEGVKAWNSPVGKEVRKRTKSFVQTARANL